MGGVEAGESTGKKRKFRGHGIPSGVLGLDGRRSMYAHQDFSTLSKNYKSQVPRGLILSRRK
jgi:hypothetical protein